MKFRESSSKIAATLDPFDDDEQPSLQMGNFNGSSFAQPPSDKSQDIKKLFHDTSKIRTFEATENNRMGGSLNRQSQAA